jgi:hypothetical protein
MQFKLVALGLLRRHAAARQRQDAQSSAAIASCAETMRDRSSSLSGAASLPN